MINNYKKKYFKYKKKYLKLIGGAGDNCDREASPENFCISINNGIQDKIIVLKFADRVKTLDEILIQNNFNEHQTNKNFGLYKIIDSRVKIFYKLNEKLDNYLNQIFHEDRLYYTLENSQHIYFPTITDEERIALEDSEGYEASDL